MFGSVAYAYEVDPNLERSLGKFARPSRAAAFFKRFEGILPVYSPGLAKIYTDYEAQYVQVNNQKKIVVQPNFEDYGSIFNYVDRYAAEPLNIYLIDGILFKKRGIYLLQQKNGQQRVISLKSGMMKLLNGELTGRRELPVVCVSEMQQLIRNHAACIRLRSVDLDELDSWSDFARRELKTAITQNVIQGLHEIN